MRTIYMSRIIYGSPSIGERAVDPIRRYLKEARKAWIYCVVDRNIAEEGLSRQEVRELIRCSYPRVYDFMVRTDVAFGCSATSFIGGCRDRLAPHYGGKEISILHVENSYSTFNWKKVTHYLAQQTSAIRHGYSDSASNNLLQMLKTKPVPKLSIVEDDPDGTTEYTIPPSQQRPDPPPPHGFHIHPDGGWSRYRPDSSPREEQHNDNPF